MGRNGRFKRVAKRALRHMTPMHMARTQVTRRTFQDVADKLGFVYFGYVNQNDDEHRLVRGHTVSPTHIDDHYCVGTLKGYDILLLLRNDVIRTARSKEERCHWLIVTIDLHTVRDIPHLYIGHKSRDSVFRAAFERLHTLDVGAYASYPANFLKQYNVFGRPTHALTIESIITPSVADVITAHFSQASFEIEDNTLFLYIESKRPSEALIEKMIANGVWLAEAIDAQQNTPS